MKFGFYTDVHFSGQAPKHRVDNYPEALVAKFSEIYQAGIDEKVDFMICCGDLFNSHRIFTYELLNSIMDVIEDSGLKTYTIVGQHELIGYNSTTYKSSTLAFVVNRCKLMEVVWKPKMVGGDVVLYPSHVWDDLKDAANFKLNEDGYNILLAHHLLTNKKAMFDVVNTGEFAKAMHKEGVNFDMVLSGDLHDGYDVHEVDGMWFCNPGSLARRPISDIRRMPRYAMIEVEKGDIPIIDVRDVKCARPGDEVFGESVAEVVRERNDFDPTAFIKEIEEFEIESADVQELIQKVGRAKGIRKEILAYIASKSQKTA